MAFAIAGGASAQAAETGFLIAVSNNKLSGYNDGAPNSGTVVAIDGENGEGLYRGEHARAGFSLAWNGSGDAYAVNGLGKGRQILVSVDANTLEVTGEVGNLVDASDPTFNHNIAAMGFDDDGTLFGISVRKELIGGFKVPVGMLVEIDTGSGLVTEIGSLGMPTYSRGATIANGAMSLLTTTSKTDREFKLFSVDLTTGDAELAGATGHYGRSAAITSDEAGNLMAVMDGTPAGGQPANGVYPTMSHLYSIDAGNGNAELLGSTGYHLLSGMAWMSREVECGVTATDKIEVKGNGIIDSISCDTGLADNDAQLCASGDIKVKDDGAIYGHVASNKKVNIEDNGYISGETQAKSGSYSVPDIAHVHGQPDLELKDNDVLTLTAGTYSYEEVKFKDDSILNVVGTVIINVHKELKFEENSQVNVGGDAGQLIFYVVGHKVEIKDDATVVATIIGEKNEVKVKDNADFTGVVFAKKLKVEHEGQVHLDECLQGMQP